MYVYVCVCIGKRTYVGIGKRDIDHNVARSTFKATQLLY